MTATHPAPSTPAQASVYQQLRAHLATLRLHDAAEHLPAVLDHATADSPSVTAILERLLAFEVTATEARRLAGRLRFASLPTRPPWATSTTAPPRHRSQTARRPRDLPIPADRERCAPWSATGHVHVVKRAASSEPPVASPAL